MNQPSNRVPEDYGDPDRFTDFDEDAYEAQKEFEEWCRDNDMDPEDAEAKDTYKEFMDEVGPSSWDDMDPDDRAGWEDNMIKWGE